MKRPIRDGFGLVWRHQRLVWWIFFVNLLLGLLASIAPRVLLRPVLDRSMYAAQLSQRFDLSVFNELLSKPEVSLRPSVASSATLSVIFLLYMIFISGGILAVYREDRKLTRGEFFHSSGDFFWRMVVLLLCSIIPFGIVYALLDWVREISRKMAAEAPREMQGFWVKLAGYLVCLVLALFVRAWFDVAQARTVIDGVRRMFKLSFQTLVLALGNLHRLLFIYLTTTSVCAIVAVAAAALWLNIPHGSFGKSWLLLEIVTLAMIALRLWQRAATALWYENYAELHPAPVPVTPAPPAWMEPVEVGAVNEAPPSTGEGGGSAI